MDRLATFILYLIHAIYSIINAASTLRRKHFGHEPQPLEAKRKKIPTHIALLFAADVNPLPKNLEQDLLDNIKLAVSWCRVVGITRLTVYDRRGILIRSSFSLRERLQVDDTDGCSSESDIEYPLTPPLSDDLDSRSLSPDYEISPKLRVTTVHLPKPRARTQRSFGRNVVKRRAQRKETDIQGPPPLTLHIISRDSGKPAISELSTRLAYSQIQATTNVTPESYALSVADVNTILEGEHGFPSPDLMIIHHVSPQSHSKNIMELHGFPPWQIGLTEFYFDECPRANSSKWWSAQSNVNPPYVPLDERGFRRALDQFSGADMRMGK